MIISVNQSCMVNEKSSLNANDTGVTQLFDNLIQNTKNPKMFLRLMFGLGFLASVHGQDIEMISFSTIRGCLKNGSIILETKLQVEFECSFNCHTYEKCIGYQYINSLGICKFIGDLSLNELGKHEIKAKVNI